MPIKPFLPDAHKTSLNIRRVRINRQKHPSSLGTLLLLFKKKKISQDYQIALLGDFSPSWALKIIRYQRNHKTSAIAEEHIETRRYNFPLEH